MKHGQKDGQISKVRQLLKKIMLRIFFVENMAIIAWINCI